MLLLAWASPKALGGADHLSFVATMLASAAFSVAVFYMAVMLAQPQATMLEMFQRKLKPASDANE